MDMVRTVAYQCASPSGPRTRVRHLKRGTTYQVLAVGEIEATGETVCVYVGEADARVWVRPLEEFGDGRFEIIKE